MEHTAQHLLWHACDSSSGANRLDNSSTSDGSNSNPSGLAKLLGGHDAATAFLAHIWETQPMHFTPSDLTKGQQQCPAQQQNCMQQDSRMNCSACNHLQQQQQQHGSKRGNSGGMSTPAEPAELVLQLLHALAPDVLFKQVLPHAWHCPVMGVEETDPVQVGGCLVSCLCMLTLNEWPLLIEGLPVHSMHRVCASPQHTYVGFCILPGFSCLHIHTCDTQQHMHAPMHTHAHSPPPSHSLT